MLKNCPECELQVSDKASFCPHCGFPFNRKISTKRKGHQRLPNGFGQITEIKNRNLRKPFRVMVTIAKDINGKPIQKPLKPEAYFTTYNDAYAALVKYNSNPYDLDMADKTVEDVYKEFMEYYEKDSKSRSAIRGLKSAWGYCSKISSMPIATVRSYMIKDLFSNLYRVDSNGNIIEASSGMHVRVRSLLSRVFDYAMQFEIISRNPVAAVLLPSDTITESKTTVNEHIAYSDEEVEKLWKIIGKNIFADMIIYQCYSGWRPGELINIRTDEVNINERVIYSGSKTDAGKNRTVPIHPKVFDIVNKYYTNAINNDYKYLFSIDGVHISESRFEDNYKKVIKQLNLNPLHRPHDGRKHFVTQCKKHKLDQYAIKRIAGHKISDITESVYTERSISWLHDEISKIP